MNVAELIEELLKMPQSAEVIMFDCATYYTPCKVYVWHGKNEKDKKDKTKVKEDLLWKETKK